MGVDSAIKTIDGMADLGAGASEATAGVSVFSSKPKGKDGAKKKRKQFNKGEPKPTADNGRSDEKANR